jgi:hypothetical protein
VGLITVGETQMVTAAELPRNNQDIPTGTPYTEKIADADETGQEMERRPRACNTGAHWFKLLSVCAHDKPKETHIEQ